MKILVNAAGARGAFEDIIEVGEHGMIRIVLPGFFP
jgi:hypothetical protein